MEATIKKVDNGFEVTFAEEAKENVIDVFATVEEMLAKIGEKFGFVAKADAGQDSAV